MRYLLDTNIVSDLVHRPQGRITRRIGEVGESSVCTSVIVAAALRYGAAKRASARLTAQLEAVLGAMEALPFEPPADQRYAEVCSALEAQGRVIGGSDMFIAAHALAAGCALITDNEAEFARVEGLRCENWLREP